MIEADPDLRLDKTSKTLIRFAPEEWYVHALTQGQGWTQSGQMLLFECYIKREDLKVVLYIGPGPKEIRDRLFSIAKENTHVFRTQSKSLNEKWNSIFSKKLLQKIDQEEGEAEEVEGRIEKAWKEFIRNDLSKITNVIKQNYTSV